MDKNTEVDASGAFVDVIVCCQKLFGLEVFK